MLYGSPCQWHNCCRTWSRSLHQTQFQDQSRMLHRRWPAQIEFAGSVIGSVVGFAVLVLAAILGWRSGQKKRERAGMIQSSSAKTLAMPKYRMFLAEDRRSEFCLLYQPPQILIELWRYCLKSLSPMRMHLWDSNLWSYSVWSASWHFLPYLSSRYQQRGWDMGKAWWLSSNIRYLTPFSFPKSFYRVAGWLQ